MEARKLYRTVPVDHRRLIYYYEMMMGQQGRGGLTREPVADEGREGGREKCGVDRGALVMDRHSLCSPNLRILTDRKMPIASGFFFLPDGNLRIVSAYSNIYTFLKNTLLMDSPPPIPLI